MSTKIPSSNQKYSQLAEELESVLSKLQLGDGDIDEATILYDRGLELAKKMQTYLDTTENKISELRANFDLDQ